MWAGVRFRSPYLDSFIHTISIMRAIIFIALICCVFAADFRADNEWRAFKTSFGKKYASVKEESVRYAHFKANQERAKIYQHLNPEAVMTANTRFGDLSPEEFRSMYLNFHTSQLIKATQTYVPKNVKDLPESFDWKDKNAVTAVKDQGQCGSCYIFSTVCNIETVWKNAGHDLISLSEQQVLDCDKVDDGCGGGWMFNVYDYVVKAGGLELEKDYPYRAYVGSCKFSKDKVAARINGFVNVTLDRNEEVMQEYMYDHAVLSVAVDATPFQYYVRGIITSGCGNSFDDLDHAVVATGWGVSGSSTKYWNIKNSWGNGWGESGYARLKRGSNTCGVAWVPTSASA